MSQNSLRLGAKTCTEFADRITEVETRISTLEDKITVQEVTSGTLVAHRNDMAWKLEDMENRL